MKIRNTNACAALATGIAGLLHATLASQAHQSIPPEWMFFIAAGVVQIIITIAILIHSNKTAHIAAILVNGALTMFWLLTRTLPAPFLDAPEHIGALDAAISILQIIAIIASLNCLKLNKKTSLKLIVGSLILGLFGYIGATVSANTMFSDIEITDHHGEPISDTHAEPSDEHADSETPTNTNLDNHDSADDHDDTEKPHN